MKTFSGEMPAVRTHAELVAEMLANPVIKAEYDRLNASEE